VNEHDPNKNIEQSGEPLYPSPLPPEMTEFFRDYDYACLAEVSDHGTVFIIKAPIQDILSCWGNVPIQVQHQLYKHFAAPVIRSLITIYDQADPLAFETFYNIMDAEQRQALTAQTQQDELLLLFYDEALIHRLSKKLLNKAKAKEELTHLIEEADGHLTNLDLDVFDFDLAKAEVMQESTLS